MPIPTKPRSGAERRESFRTVTWIRLRLRPAEELGRPSVLDGDLLGQFEGLVSAATSARTEAGPYARLFIDKLLGVTDAMIGEMERIATAGGADWQNVGHLEADLSVGGIGFAIDNGPMIGTSVELYFRLPDAVTAIPFRLRGTVVHARASDNQPNWLGVRFEEMTDAIRMRLGRAVLDLQRLALRESHGR